MEGKATRSPWILHVQTAATLIPTRGTGTPVGQRGRLSVPPDHVRGETFYLPAFKVRSRRIVNIDVQIWKIWSPNSITHPFYPGLRDPSIDLEKDLPADRRRCDGHLGCFDPTVSPQYYDLERPWLGFIQKSVDESRPEDISLLKEWQPYRAPNLGTIRPTYVKLLQERANGLRKRFDKWESLAKSHPEVWENRPSCPKNSDFEELRLPLSFDKAVDLLTKTQRAIKYVCDWYKYKNSVLAEDKNKAKALNLVEGTDETLMGSWLNGCDETGRDRVFSYDPLYYSFTSNTYAAGLVANINPFDLAVNLDKGDRLIVSDVVKDFASLPAQGGTTPMFADRVRSSPVVQGYDGEKYDGEKYEDPRSKPPSLSPANPVGLPHERFIIARDPADTIVQGLEIVVQNGGCLIPTLTVLTIHDLSHAAAPPSDTEVGPRLTNVVDETLLDPPIPSIVNEKFLVLGFLGGGLPRRRRSLSPEERDRSSQERVEVQRLDKGKGRAQSKEFLVRENASNVEEEPKRMDVDGGSYYDEEEAREVEDIEIAAKARSLEELTSKDVLPLMNRPGVSAQNNVVPPSRRGGRVAYLRSQRLQGSDQSPRSDLNPTRTKSKRVRFKIILIARPGCVQTGGIVTVIFSFVHISSVGQTANPIFVPITLY
ncbi:hypothetical protein CVT26_005809 [Gymnopilus dilepis]|uniref:Uncharacterized protein n=1 Tax=Gymnopilus dilepis TaxID=231916 RepID=A0A409WG26_9AGAR|nr:hypothetical protein CVT26_005809 [Gymnopilus dilepis]